VEYTEKGLFTSYGAAAEAKTRHPVAAKTKFIYSTIYSTTIPRKRKPRARRKNAVFPARRRARGAETRPAFDLGRGDTTLRSDVDPRR